MLSERKVGTVARCCCVSAMFGSCYIRKELCYLQSPTLRLSASRSPNRTINKLVYCTNMWTMNQNVHLVLYWTWQMLNVSLLITVNEWNDWEKLNINQWKSQRLTLYFKATTFYLSLHRSDALGSSSFLCPVEQKLQKCFTFSMILFTINHKYKSALSLVFQWETNMSILVLCKIYFLLYWYFF